MIGHQKEILKKESSYLSNNAATLRDFYLRYPYKKSSGRTTLPYVPVEEDTNEPFSLKYKDWKNILHTYFKYVLLYLLTGQPYRFSSGIGEFKLIRYKPRKKRGNIDMRGIEKYYEKKTGITDRKELWAYINNIGLDNAVLVKHRNKETDGYKWVTAWFKKEYKFAFKQHWYFTLARVHAWKMLDTAFKKDRLLIYNINETKRKTTWST